MRLPRAFRSFCETVLSFKFLVFRDKDEIATIAAQSRNDDLIADEIATHALRARNDDFFLTRDDGLKLKDVIARSGNDEAISSIKLPSEKSRKGFERRARIAPKPKTTRF